ncbi:penicillin-binding protein [Bacillaceae bacterium W0354]
MALRKFNQSKLMVFLLIVSFTFFFLLIIGRFMYIQITGEVHSVDLISYADKVRDTQSVLPAERGKIVDRNGMVLADNKPIYRMYAIVRESFSDNSPKPLHVVDAQKTAEKLSEYINLEAAEIRRIIEYGKDNQEDIFQVEFGRAGNMLSEDVKNKIEALELSGINFTRESVRFYPNGEFASHVLGFTETKVYEEENRKEIVGAYGIELEYEEYLKGTPGYVKYQRDKYGYKLMNAHEFIQPPKDGSDIVLTIDQKIQTFLEDAMSTVVEEYDPVQMIAVVMNPKTGEILAMSNRPSFDPNIRDVENWYNDAISYPFEPGSTMKIFTLAAAIEEGVYDGSETFMSGQYRINENFRPIHDWNTDWGEITFDEGVQRSSNVAFAKLVWEKLGTDKFLDYLYEFHFDRATDIDLSGELVGKILYQYPMEKLTAAFGQGSTYTPIQLMKAASAIANDGKMVKPYITNKIVDSSTNEIIFQNEPEIVGEPISEQTAEQVKELLASTIYSDVGTGKRFKLENFTTFGKTGTAQIPDPETGKYMEGSENYIFSFLGMAPKDDPQLMMYVAIKQPKVNHYSEGSIPVSYIYRTVMENSLHYLEVNPDRDEGLDIDQHQLENVINQATEDVIKRYSDNDVVVIGNGSKIVDSYPKEGDVIVPNKRIIFITDGELTMPDITNWTLRDVLTLVDLLNMNIDYIGNGFVTNQSIRPNAIINADSHLVVELKTKQQIFEQQLTNEEFVENNESNTIEEES